MGPRSAEGAVASNSGRAANPPSPCGRAAGHAEPGFLSVTHRVIQHPIGRCGALAGCYTARMFPSPLMLVGFMGAGKSTVGRRLAHRLGWYFCDLDQRIEAAAGATIPEIFSRQGEAAFRAVERDQLATALAEAGSGHRMVIALGGGTFAQAGNVELIRQTPAMTLFLDVPFDELLLRCAQMTNRPLFRDELSFRELYVRRLPFYQAADLTVAAGGGTPEEVVERILAALASIAGRSRRQVSTDVNSDDSRLQGYGGTK